MGGRVARVDGDRIIVTSNAGFFILDISSFVALEYQEPRQAPEEIREKMINGVACLLALSSPSGLVTVYEQS